MLLALTVRYFVKAENSQVEHAYVAFDVSPDGKQVVFSSADADLYLFDLKTRQVQPLTKSAALETQPTFSPDGQLIVYASSVKEGDPAGIFVRSLDGRERCQLTPGRAANDMMPSYSPDGKRITFVRASRRRPYSMGGWIWGNYDVCGMNRDGSGVRHITQHNYYQASRPHFLNNDTVVFTASGDYPDTVTYLFAASADGARSPTKLMPPTVPLSADGSSPSYCAVWSNDSNAAPLGKQIVFVSDRTQSYRYDLWVTSMSGGKPRPLNVTGVSGYNQEPVFTPDGEHILFLAGTEQNASSRPIFSLWDIDVDGSHAHRLADSGLFTSPLHWKPRP